MLTAVKGLDITVLLIFCRRLPGWSCQLCRDSALAAVALARPDSGVSYRADDRLTEQNLALEGNPDGALTAMASRVPLLQTNLWPERFAEISGQDRSFFWPLPAVAASMLVLALEWLAGRSRKALARTIIAAQCSPVKCGQFYPREMQVSFTAIQLPIRASGINNLLGGLVLGVLLSACASRPRWRQSG